MLVKHCAMNTNFEVEVLHCSFLIMTLDRHEWSASGPARFTPSARAHSIYWIKDHVDL